MSGTLYHPRRAATRLLLAMMLMAGVAHAALPERPIDFAQLRGEFPPVAVIAEGSSGCIRLDTLLAATNAERARGLMFVRSMPADAGMLFYYPRPRELSPPGVAAGVGTGEGR